MKKRVLFLCTGNSARSQMAEALFGLIAGDHFEASSAYTHPARLNPLRLRLCRTSVGCPPVSIEACQCVHEAATTMSSSCFSCLPGDWPTSHLPLVLSRGFLIPSRTGRTRGVLESCPVFFV